MPPAAQLIFRKALLLRSDPARGDERLVGHGHPLREELLDRIGVAADLALRRLGRPQRDEIHEGASIHRPVELGVRADRQDGDVAEAKTVRLKEKIEGLRRQMQSLKEMGKQVEASPDKQVSLTDPDARSMATSGKAPASSATMSRSPSMPSTI